MSLFPPDNLRCLESLAWARGRDDYRFGLPQPTGGDLYHPRHKVHYLAGYAAAKADQETPLTDRQIANLLEAAKVPPEPAPAIPEALPPSLRPLWDLMAKTHGLALTSSELYDIQAAAKVPPEPPTIADTLKAFRDAANYLQNHQRAHFPEGLAVQVNHNRYKGPGVIHSDPYCPVGAVAVQLPNSNTWWYPLESVHVAPTP